jgi:opacity protein-like surface antigen
MRSYLLSGACAASMLLALAPIAQAADIEELVPEPQGFGWYISVFGGWSMPRDEEFSVETTGATPDSLVADIELDDGFMVGAALGAQINEWLRGEVEVSGHFHDAEGEAVFFERGLVPATVTYGIDGEEDALFVLANLWVDFPIGGVIRPYVGGGVGFGHLDVDVSFDSAGGSEIPIVDDSDWGFAWQVGGGVAFDVSENIAIDVGYRYKRIENADLEADDELEVWLASDVANDVEKDYRSHNILLGLRFGF